MLESLQSDHPNCENGSRMDRNPGENASELKALHITLNPNGVAAPAQRAVVIASQVVGICLRGLANDDLSPPEMQGGFIGYKFDSLEMSNEERRETYQNWILSKGFQDLARGVRETDRSRARARAGARAADEEGLARSSTAGVGGRLRVVERRGLRRFFG